MDLSAASLAYAERRLATCHQRRMLPHDSPRRVTFVVGDFKQSSSTGTHGASTRREQLRHRASQRVVVTGARPRPVVPSHQFTRRLGLLRERHSARPGSVERMGYLAGYVAYRSFRPAARARAPPRATTPKTV